MNKLLLIMPLLALTSCASLMPDTAETGQTSTTSVPEVADAQTSAERPVAAPSQFQPARFAGHSQDYIVQSPADKITIQHFVRGMMQEMVMAMQDVNEQTPVAVASFLYLDTDYNTGNMLGNQVAESFMHELHNFGVKVLDYKLTDYIRVTETGDLVHSRNYEELGGTLAARYAVGGTLTKHKDGVMINARMVEFESKVVVASAQSLVPAKIINALMPSVEANTTPLIKGR
uniref:Flagellar protein FlgO n=1 Tax=Rheinheimera sp. BAL341 TaxID=1708203 RepID=A0A486XWH3_9GAMM